MRNGTQLAWAFAKLKGCAQCYVFPCKRYRWNKYTENDSCRMSKSMALKWDNLKEKERRRERFDSSMDEFYIATVCMYCMNKNSCYSLACVTRVLVFVAFLIRFSNTLGCIAQRMQNLELYNHRINICWAKHVYEFIYHFQYFSSNT